MFGNHILLTEYGDDEACFTIQQQVLGDDVRENKVLINVKACGVSYLDLETRKGKYQAIHPTLPQVLGYEVAGQIALLGEEVTRFQRGDSVVAFIPLDQNGGNGDYVEIEDIFVAHKPENVTWEEAAGSIGGGIRALSAFHASGSLAAGDSVLILDGNLFDQQIAIQLALYRSLQVLTSIQSDSEFIERLEGRIEVIDLREEELCQGVLERSSGLGVDFIMEAPSYFANHYDCYPVHKMITCLAPQGSWVTCRQVQLDPPASHMLMLKSNSISFLFEQSWVLAANQQGRFLHYFNEIMERMKKGDLSIRIGKAFKLEKVNEAHAYVIQHPERKAVLFL